MNKILVIGVIALPLLLFLILFGQNILDNFIRNENDQIDASNDVLRAVVGGQGWTSPGNWTTTTAE